MPDVVIYTKPWCGYCHRARRLLTAKGVAFHEIDLRAHPEREAEMIERSGGRRTVPQVFLDGRHIGDSDELAALERSGRLDQLLAAAAAQHAGKETRRGGA